MEDYSSTKLKKKTFSCLYKYLKNIQNILNVYGKWSYIINISHLVTI